MFKQRLGTDPHIQGKDTSGAAGCPDIWELEDGNIAIIGLRNTAILKAQLPSSASCGIDEEIVIIPRQILKNAIEDIKKL